MIDTDRYEGHTPDGWYVDDAMDVIHPTVIHSNETDNIIAELVMANVEEWTEEDYANARLIADAPLLLKEYKRLRSEPTVTVDDYHKKGHLYITVYFPDGEQYVGLVEKWEGEEE